MATESHVFERNILIAVVSRAIITFIGILSKTALNIAYALLMNEFGISAIVIQWLTTGHLRCNRSVDCLWNTKEFHGFSNFICYRFDIGIVCAKKNALYLTTRMKS